jgi:polysaccharide export outer membrane protein
LSLTTNLLAFVLLAASAQAQPKRQAYRLGPGDQIALRVVSAPEITDKPIRIGADGFIKLPMAGRIQAGGLTPEQLETVIADRLKFYLEKPEVAVSVAEFQSQPVSILGAVGAPGVHQLEGRKTLVEMISMAGGLRPDAATTAKITRRLEQGRVPLPGAKDDLTGEFSIAEVDIKGIIDARTPENNIVILPEDVISIPKAEMIYVLGDVNRPGTLPLTSSQTMSALEALSNAGGATRTAKSEKSRILRAKPGSTRRTEILIDLKQIQNGKADDVRLLAGDILFVPSGNRGSGRALEALIQGGIAVGTYGLIR